MATREQNIRAKKMMLWFSMISITMTFAGLTSAYIVSKARPDWLSNFELPIPFYWSTLVIILSSITFWRAKKELQVSNLKRVSSYLIFTLLLALIFVLLQFNGFGHIVQKGYYFTGVQSTVTTSFLYILVVVHLAHLLAGIVVLSVVLFNHSKKKYEQNPLGFELAHTFWHFLDFLWLYLFLFLYFLI